VRGARGIRNGKTQSRRGRSHAKKIVELVSDVARTVASKKNTSSGRGGSGGTREKKGFETLAFASSGQEKGKLATKPRTQRNSRRKERGAQYRKRGQAQKRSKLRVDHGPRARVNNMGQGFGVENKERRQCRTANLKR